MVTLQEVQAAHYLHAQHYLTRLKSYAKLYRIENHVPSAVRQFEADWHQIEHSFNWTTNTENEDGMELCLGFWKEASPFIARRRGKFHHMDWSAAALQVAQRLGKRDHMARHLGQLGVIHLDSAEHETAREYFLASLELAQEFEMLDVIILCCHNLGIIAKHLGQQAKARDYFEQALAVAREMGDEAEIARCLSRLSTSAYEMGELDSAIALGREALETYERIGNPERIAYTAYALGSYLLSTDDQIEDARRFLWRSYDLYKQLGYERMIASAGCNLGSDLIVNQGEYEQGIQLVEEALEIYRADNVRKLVCNAIAVLGDAAFKQGDLQGARERYTEALDLAQEIKTTWNIITILLSLGRVENQAEQFDEAWQRLTTALTVAVETQTASLGRMVLVQLAATLACQTGQIESAVELIACAIADAEGDKLVDREAEPILAQLQEELPASVFAQALERGGQLDFDRVAKEYMSN